MEAILKSDVFFVISSISVIILTILFIIVLIYVIVILNRAKKAIKVIENKVEDVKEEIAAFKERTLKSSIIGSILKIFIPSVRKIKKTK